VRCDREAALHVRDAGADQAIPFAPQRLPGDGAQRKDGVVVAEQRHAGASGARQDRVHVQTCRRRHQFARTPVRRERARDLGRERVELGQRAARRVVAHPAGDVGEDEVEIRPCGGLHAPGGGDRFGHAPRPTAG
jgi:hypothetical protein